MILVNPTSDEIHKLPEIAKWNYLPLILDLESRIDHMTYIKHKITYLTNMSLMWYNTHKLIH